MLEMNINNYNCHAEPADASQLNYVSPRDVAEGAKLNHKTAKELEKASPELFLYSCRLSWSMTCLLGALFFLPNFAHAETCTVTPDCKTLGYTETSCPDGGGVKCPWNTSLMYCCKKCKEQPPCMSCFVGWILNSDMTCSQNKTTGKTPVGVVASQTLTAENSTIKCQGFAIALNDLSEKMTWSNASLKSRSYIAGGVSGWHLPTKKELLTVHDNISFAQEGLKTADGVQLNLGTYWSADEDPTVGSTYYVVTPVGGGVLYYGSSATANHYVRPVLAF